MPTVSQDPTPSVRNHDRTWNALNPALSRCYSPRLGLTGAAVDTRPLLSPNGTDSRMQERADLNRSARNRPGTSLWHKLEETIRAPIAPAAIAVEIVPLRVTSAAALEFQGMAIHAGSFPAHVEANADEQHDDDRHRCARLLDERGDREGRQHDDPSRRGRSPGWRGGLLSSSRTRRWPTVRPLGADTRRVGGAVGAIAQEVAGTVIPRVIDAVDMNDLIEHIDMNALVDSST